MLNTKSILIIGGSGFLGTHLSLKLRAGYKVFATYHKHALRIPGVTCIPLNVENRQWAKRIVYTARPDVVIYVAGHPNIDWNEVNSKSAERLHTTGPATLANITDMIQPKFIFLSTAYVFDGFRGNYHETETVSPGNNMGKVKLSGENLVKNKFFNHIIIRSSPIFGRANGLNVSFLDRMRMNLDRGKRMTLSRQEVHSFGSIDGLSDLVHRLIESGVKNRVLHYGGLTKVTYFEFGRAYAKFFGYDPNLIIPVKHNSKDYSEDAFQQDFSLNSTQASELLKIKPLLLEESFDLIQKKLISTT